MSAELLHWHAPGPYTVAFTTRHGGVSKGAFASLNLGLKTDEAHGEGKAKPAGAKPSHVTTAPWLNSRR